MAGRSWTARPKCGDGSATVDLVFAGDVARANVMALKSPVTNEFFNVASGVETTLRELAYLLIRLRGKEGKLEPEFQAMDTGLVTRRWGCACSRPARAAASG